MERQQQKSQWRRQKRNSRWRRESAMFKEGKREKEGATNMFYKAGRPRQLGVEMCPLNLAAKWWEQDGFHDKELRSEEAEGSKWRPPSGGAWLEREGKDRAMTEYRGCWGRVWSCGGRHNTPSTNYQLLDKIGVCFGAFLLRARLPMEERAWVKCLLSSSFSVWVRLWACAHQRIQASTRWLLRSQSAPPGLGIALGQSQASQRGEGLHPFLQDEDEKWEAGCGPSGSVSSLCKRAHHLDPIRQAGLFLH